MHFQPHFDPFVHKIFLDLIQNIDYDYYQQLNDFKCNGTSHHLDIFVWQSARNHKHSYIRIFFLASLLQNKFPKTDVYIIRSSYKHVDVYISVKNHFRYSVRLQSAKYTIEISEFLKRLKELEKQVHIVVRHIEDLWEKDMLEGYRKTMGHSIKNPYRGWTNLSRFKNFLEKIRIPPGKMPKFSHTPWKENF